MKLATDTRDEVQFAFLICSERSGSNLLTKIFDSHPEVCGPSPAHLVEILSAHLWRYGNLDIDSNWEGLVSDAVDIMNSKFAVWRRSFTSSEILTHLEERSLSAIVRYVYTAEAIANGKSRLLIKERHLYRFAPLFLCAFPEANYIYLVRDPRDMVLSWKRSPRRPGGTFRGCQVWKEDQSQSIPLFSFLKEFGKITLIRYEDLLRNTEAEVRRLCHVVNLSYAPEMLNFYKDDLTRQNSGATPSWQNLKKPLMSSNYGKYKSGLTQDEVKYIEAICHEEMTYLGYQPDYDITPDLSRLEKQLLLAESEDKSYYDRMPASERKVRLARAKVIERIEKRRAFESH